MEEGRLRKVSKRAYMFPLATALRRKRLRPSLELIFLNLEKTSKDVFSSLASGKQRIPIPASVRSGRSPSRSDAKRKRSALDRPSGRGITNLSICERSELREKNSLKEVCFLKTIHRKKWFKISFLLV